MEPSPPGFPDVGYRHGRRRPRRTLLLPALFFLVAGLGLDQAGSTVYGTAPRFGRPFGKPFHRTIRAPAGTYRIIIQAWLAGDLDEMRVEVGMKTFQTHLRSIGRSYTFSVPVGTIVHSGGEIPVTVKTSKAAGRVGRVLLEPAGILPISRGDLQRLCLAVAALLVALALLPRHPFLLASAIASYPVLRLLLFGLVPFGGDRRTAFFPWWELTRRLLSNGKIPLWNSHTYLGFPHFANIQTQILFPPAFLMGLFDIPFPARETTLMLLQFLLAFCGTWILARRLGFPRISAALAGILYMVSYPVVLANQSPVSLTAALIPGLVASFVRPHSILVPALTLALTLFAGHLQYTSYGLIGACCFAFPRKRRTTRRLAGFLLGIVLASVLLLPFLEYARNSVRSEGLAPSHAGLGGLAPDFLESALDPGFARRDTPPLGASRPPAARFAGIFGLPLLACSIAGLGRRRRANLVGIIAVGTIGLALALGDVGPLSPYHYLLSVPPFAASRGPARAIVLTILAAALLAGQGFTRLAAAARKPRLLVLPALLCPILLALPAALSLHLGTKLDWILPWLCWDLLAAFAFLAIPLLFRRRLATTLVACTIVIAFRTDDAQGERPGTWPNVYAVVSHHPHTPHLRDMVNPFSFKNDSLVRGDLSPYGYDPVIPRRNALLWDRIDPDQFPFDTKGRLAAVQRRLPSRRLLTPRAIETLRAMGVATLTVGKAEASFARPLLSATTPPIRRLPRRPNSFQIRGAARARLTRSYRSVSSMEEARRLLIPASSRFGLLGELRILRGDETYSTEAPESRGPIALNSFLKDGRSLAQGSVVATMELFRQDAKIADLPIRAGMETADAELEDPAARRPPGHKLARIEKSYSLSLHGRILPLHVYRATILTPATPFDRIVIRKAPGSFLLYLSSLVTGAKAREPDPLFPPQIEGAVPFPSTPGKIHPLLVEDLGETQLHIALPRIKRPMLLVVADTWYPGWQGTVDGAPRPILPADIAFRAIAVKPGDRLIEMRYRPFSYRLGLFLTCIGIILAALLSDRG